MHIYLCMCTYIYICMYVCLLTRVNGFIDEYFYDLSIFMFIELIVKMQNLVYSCVDT